MSTTKTPKPPTDRHFRKTDRHHGFAYEQIMDYAAGSPSFTIQDLTAFNGKGLEDNRRNVRALVQLGRLAVIKKPGVGRYSQPGIYCIGERA